ncbi:MAG TPA: hypothetical protein VGG75_38225 [Trebonia sp.]|jgi:hypothetical protein
MFGIFAFILFIVAAVIGWNGNPHAAPLAYAGLACLTAEVVFAWRPWTHS